MDKKIADQLVPTSSIDAELQKAGKDYSLLTDLGKKLLGLEKW
mgnify:CR=1 FL=1